MIDAITRMFVRALRRPWLGASVCVLVCAALAARAVGHVLEARYLGAARTAPNVPRVDAPAPPSAPAVDRGAEGSSLVARDMFCSTCAPAPVAHAPGSRDELGVPLTSLPLVLVATSAGMTLIATVRDDRNGSQGAYEMGESLPGAGAITRIGATFVDFMNPIAAREERVSLLALAATKAPDAGPQAAAAAPADADPFADHIRKLDDTRYEVDRAMVRDLVGAAGKPIPGVRMLPTSKDGKLNGVRVAQARPDSLAGALGLKPGDQLGAVNGVAIDSIDKMLEVYSKLDNTNVVTIDGTRGGKPISWQYNLR